MCVKSETRAGVSVKGARRDVTCAADGVAVTGLTAGRAIAPQWPYWVSAPHASAKAAQSTL